LPFRWAAGSRLRGIEYSVTATFCALRSKNNCEHGITITRERLLCPCSRLDDWQKARSRLCHHALLNPDNDDAIIALRLNERSHVSPTNFYLT
jgi:hypothetical protein